MRCLALPILALLFLAPPLRASPDLPPGRIVSRVACRADPSQGYALYLPPGYHEGPAWPVLFGFSPDGQGEDPVRHFQKAAARFGWIVVGSHGSRNGPLRPALKAAEAVWKDVNERFHVDPQRSHAAGFSGGARMALRLVQARPRRFAGLISIGAFGTGGTRFTGLSHLGFYLACGNEDFNHGELLEGRSLLQDRRWSVLADRFEGGHRWPPEAVCEEAVAFLQLCAQRRGLIPRDPTLEAELRARLADRAEAAAGTGQALLALRRWEEVVSNFPGSPEAERGRERAGALRRDPAVEAGLRLEAEHPERSRALAEARSSPGYGEALARLVAQAKVPGGPDAVAARRLLGAEALAFTLAAQEAMDQKDWPRSAALLRSLAALEWREAWPCILAAGSLARLGNREEALAFLREARARGYRRPERLRALDLLSDLSGDPRYEALLKEMEPAP